MTQSWKKGRPTETGWYWGSAGRIGVWIAYYFDKDGSVRVGGEIMPPWDHDRYYFLGPIKPPDPPEVTP